jgi:hypothetical protein
MIGLRVCSQAIRLLDGPGADIVIHDSIEESRSDFDYIFSPAYALWKGMYIVDHYRNYYGGSDDRDELVPFLKNFYGDGFHSFDTREALVASRTEHIHHWGPYLTDGMWRFFVIVRDYVDFGLIGKHYYQGKETLKNGVWPRNFHTVIQCYDGMFWQVFSRDETVITVLKEHHRLDPQLVMYYVCMEDEFPEPSDEMPTPV